MRAYTLPLLAALCTVLPAASQAADAAAGLYSTCATCHGADGGGDRASGAPRLSHLSPVYIAAQLEKFRGGQRGGAGDSPAAQGMAAMAKTLPDEQALLAVAEYAASLGGGPSPVTVEGDAVAGADYYRQLCGACHGAQAEGNRALHSPRLAGSDDWYLVRQLEAFRGGERGGDPADTSGRQMRAMAMTLPGEQALNDVVSYLRGLAE